MKQLCEAVAAEEQRRAAQTAKRECDRASKPWGRGGRWACAFTELHSLCLFAFNKNSIESFFWFSFISYPVRDAVLMPHFMI